jgi:hypothetical protein
MGVNGDIGRESGTPRMRGLRAARLLALLAIITTIYYFLSLGLVHLLRRDVDPVTEEVSNYAVGSWGFLNVTGILGLGLGALALTFGLHFGISRPGRSRIGLILLGLYGVAQMLTAIFPIDTGGGEATTSGTLHNTFGSIAFFAFPPAAILLSWRIRKDERWSIQPGALVLSLVVLAAAVFTVMSDALGILGLGQRTFLVTAPLWMLLMAIGLRSVVERAFAERPMD